MGQLIKLQDYVSRYEQNIFLYPSRYVRLKKQQWQKLQALWEKGDSFDNSTEPEPLALPEWYEEEKEPFFQRLKGVFIRRKKEVDLDENNSEESEQIEKEESTLHFSPTISFSPNSLEELKHQFLDQLFRFQIKWASTTLAEKSFVDKKFFVDSRLKYFLQRFPDTFLVLYHPIFLVKKAPVEVDTILITPTDVWCITFLEQEDLSVFVGGSEHFWIKRNQDKEEKVLNPLITLNRTEKIVRNIFKLYEVDLPIHKVVLSRNGYFDFPSVPYDIKLIEKRNYDKWFQSMRAHRSPLKHVQFKGAQALLDYCQTTSIRRLEWELSPEEE